MPLAYRAGAQFPSLGPFPVITEAAKPSMVSGGVGRWPDEASGMDAMPMTFLDQPPDSRSLTSYDREHMKLYLRLLDAEADGADWREAVRVLFAIDPQKEPERARLVHGSHLARAKWMTEQGYRELMKKDTRSSSK